MPVPVAGYYRVSQARDDMHAPEIYETEIRRYCDYKQLTIGKIYSDIDHSAFRGAKPRPSLQDLVEHRANYAAVVIPKLSRFGRSMKELIKLFDVFDSDSIPLVFLDMDLDTSTSQGRLLRHILAAFAEYESDVKADYTRANMARIAEAGRPTGPLAPYGYTVVGKGSERTYVIDPERAEIVTEIFTRYAFGRGGFSAIARDLNQRGVVGIKGGHWTRERVRTLIDNPAFAGLRRHNGECFPAVWPAIIDSELWDATRTRREANRRVQRAERERGLLSGLLVCGVCERPLHRHSYGSRKVYECRIWQDLGARCSGGQISAARAEGLLIGAINQLFELVTEREAERGAAWRSAWRVASVDVRRKLLREVVERVTLIPRVGNRHGKGQRMGRAIRICWGRDWSLAAFGHVEAFSVLTPQDPNVRSSAGKTWAEWTRELIASRR